MSEPHNVGPGGPVSLPKQFLLAGCLVMMIAMGVVGYWVSSRIEKSVVQNSAQAAALYMDSFVSPLSQDLAASEQLSPPAQQALREIFGTSALRDRLVSYKIWKPGGLVVFASDPAIIGQRFEPTEDLKEAWAGRISGSYEDLDHAESEAEAALGIPLLEVYSPIREAWSGRVIGVAEFYQRADTLEADLASARLTSLAVVGATFLASGVILFGIVSAGGGVIRRQGAMLEKRVVEAEEMGRQNLALKASAVAASARSTAQSDRYLRQLGSDLHDGPAQHLAFATLRLDAALESVSNPTEAAEEVRKSLDAALQEVRAISRGLSTPDLDELALAEVVEKAVADFTTINGPEVKVEYDGRKDVDLDYTRKLSVLRFLQETLSNAARYAPGANIKVSIGSSSSDLTISVADGGPGFDVSERLKIRADGGQGLLGLTDRAESIGGHIKVESQPGTGTTVTMVLPIS